MKKTNDCFLKVKDDYLDFLKKEKIFTGSRTEKIESLKKVYIPMSFWIENKYKRKGKTLFLGFSGGQGSGKTTIAEILKIKDTDPGVRGDTAQGGSKPATLETGTIVKVPLFIDAGDSLKIDTRTGEYVSRAKE